MSVTENDNKDINDVFDDIFLSEDKIIGEAYQEGIEKGKRDGSLDGYHVGYHRGAELGAEIGFYKGVVDTLACGEYQIDGASNEKFKNLLERLKSSLEAFPRTNNYEVNVQTLLDDIRAQYKKLCSISKLNLSYPTFSKMSF